MARYFLDTHIIGWLLSNNPKLDERIRDDIEYPSGNRYFTSEFVILELMHLKQLGKLYIAGGAKDLLKMLYDRNIELELITKEVFDSLEKLPILTINKERHTDMIDRIIIADCIAGKHTCISHDTKFPHYRKYGLKLLEYEPTLEHRIEIEEEA